MNNRLQIDAAQLAANFHEIQRAAGPETEILAVIKANAYGHGAELCAQILTAAGARHLGVTSAAEGARVRNALAGAPAEIVVMCGFLPEDVPLIANHDLTTVIWTPEHAGLLPQGSKVHVEIDTGMGRQGLAPDISGSYISGGEWLKTVVVKHVLVGIYTHLCSAEVSQSAVTNTQLKRFFQSLEPLAASGCQVPFLHIGNSSFVHTPPPGAEELSSFCRQFGARPMVRTGLALYGYLLPVEGLTSSPAARLQVRPVLTWLTRVIAIRELSAGDTVGYSATFIAAGPLRVALIPAGYADGLRRELSNRGWVMFGDRKARILGRISMNLTVVDVSHIEGVTVGSEAIILGPGITADDHAALAETISYEILCGLHPCG